MKKLIILLIGILSLNYAYGANPANGGFKETNREEIGDWDILDKAVKSIPKAELEVEVAVSFVTSEADVDCDGDGEAESKASRFSVEVDGGVRIGGEFRIPAFPAAFVQYSGGFAGLTVTGNITDCCGTVAGSIDIKKTVVSVKVAGGFGADELLSFKVVGEAELALTGTIEKSGAFKLNGGPFSGSITWVATLLDREIEQGTIYPRT